jgi:hypothetical protein
MRRPVDKDRIRRFMAALGAEVDGETRLYFTSGASAVLLGLRPSTNELDIKIEPESDRVFRALPRLEEELELDIEIASTDQFIPELPGWQERSLFISREGQLSFYHYDLPAQVLSKVQRGHWQDFSDVKRMLDGGHVDRAELRRRFEEIEPRLYRNPGIDRVAFRRSVEELTRS